MDFPFRIGTRGSPLALAQARLVVEALGAAHGWEESRIEIVEIATTGDRVQDRALAEIGGKALWTKELDRALGTGETHVSVHSMKDVETIRPAEFELVAILPRAGPRARGGGGAPREARGGSAGRGPWAPPPAGPR
ncbi:MAG: hydroxymethylbilane synthase, partial [Sphingomonadaceae bacterium]